MSISEHDVREALAVEPDRAAVARLTAFSNELAAGNAARSLSTSRASTRRLVLPALAVAAVALIATAGAVVLTRDGQAPTAPAGGPSGTPVRNAAQLRPTWDFAATAVPGYQITRDQSYRQAPTRSSSATIAATNAQRPETGFITVCIGARDDCVKLPSARGQAVRIDHHTGRFYPGHHVSRTSLAPQLYRQPWTAANGVNDAQPELLWNVGQATTVAITGTFGFDPATYDYDNSAARTIMLRIARALQLGGHDPVLMPFALVDLPADVAPEAAFLARDQHCIGYGAGRRHGEWVGSVMTACRVRTAPTRNATITAADNITPSEAASVAIHDFPDGTSVVVEVDSGKSGSVSADEAQNLADHADVSPNLDNPSTWLAIR